MNIPIHETLKEAAYDEGTRMLSGVILSAGLSKNGNFYPTDTVEKAAGRFVGAKCFIDHARNRAPGERSIRDVCGIVESCRAESGRLKALIRISSEHDWIASMVNEGILGDVSINALGRTKLTRRDGRVVREVTEISKAYSVDFVTDAAAGGRVEALLRESAGYAEGLRLIESMTIAELRESRPDLVERIREEGGESEDSIDEPVDDIPVEEDEPDEPVQEVNETERANLVESVLASRNLPDEVSDYLRGQLRHRAEVADGITVEALNMMVEDHLEYLGRLAGNGRIRSASIGDPLSGLGAGAKASTLQFLGVTSPSKPNAF